MVPAERVLYSAAEARHMKAVLMLLIFHTAKHMMQHKHMVYILQVCTCRCMCLSTVYLCKCQPEALVQGMFVLVAPVLQVNAKAVVSLGAQVMYVVVAQPEL